MIERGRVGAMQDRRGSQRRRPVEHDRHLLHARREDRSGRCREFASAEAAKDLQRVFQMRAMQGEPLIDQRRLAGDHGGVGAGTCTGPLGPAAAVERGKDRGGGCRAANADVADRKQIDAAGQRLHAERHRGGAAALVECRTLAEIGRRHVQRQIIDLQPEIVGDADLVDRGATGSGKLDQPLRRFDRARRNIVARDAVIAGEDGDDGTHDLWRAAGRSGEPRGDLLQPAERACRLVHSREGLAHPRRRVVVQRRQMGKQRAKIVEGQSAGHGVPFTGGERPKRHNRVAKPAQCGAAAKACNPPTAASCDDRLWILEQRQSNRPASSSAR